LRKEFQGDAAVELGVFGFVDNAHSTFSQLAEDAVARDELVVHWEKKS